MNSNNPIFKKCLDMMHDSETALCTLVAVADGIENKLTELGVYDEYFQKKVVTIHDRVKAIREKQNTYYEFIKETLPK